MQVLFSLFKKSRTYYMAFHIYIIFSYALINHFHTKVSSDTHYVSWHAEKKKDFSKNLHTLHIFPTRQISDAVHQQLTSCCFLCCASFYIEMTWNQFLWLLLTTVQKSYSCFTPGDVLFWDLLKEKVDEMRDCIIQNNIDAAIQNRLCIICWIHTEI